jgi:hypothetical protein
MVALLRSLRHSRARTAQRVFRDYRHLLCERAGEPARAALNNGMVHGWADRFKLVPELVEQASDAIIGEVNDAFGRERCCGEFAILVNDPCSGGVSERPCFQRRDSAP